MKRIIKQCGLGLLDIILIYTALILSLLVRFEGGLPAYFSVTLILSHGVYICAFHISAFYLFKLYKSLWEYAGTKELLMLVCAVFCGTITSAAFSAAISGVFPLSVFPALCTLVIILAGGARVSLRLIRRVKCIIKRPEYKKAMIIGAGAAGSIIIKEMNSNTALGSKPVIAIDDDINKIGKIINGIKVVGNSDSIVFNAQKYNIDEIVFAIPSADNQIKNKIMQICARTKCSILAMPPITKPFLYNRLDDILRPGCIDELLGRQEVKLNLIEVAGYLKNKKVLITGGGGSIGSEIARQIVKFGIKKLVLLDIYENNVYELLTELKTTFNEVDIEIAIGSVCDKLRMEAVFSLLKPDVVFHAAAYKHVPLMEQYPAEAVKNNVLGTFNIVKLADLHGVKKFILISTDKAINPKSVMGATKRIAEMIIQAMDKRSRTEYMAVRFGNVLGSNGSVIPIFKKQIEAGGPVTVTHPEMRRYFMTISEASQLVIQAGALAKGGEIFVLNMGEPVKIIDLARNMIRLSGRVPHLDIKIKITGLRPGEKLFEELLLDNESLKKTRHQRIFVEKPYSFSLKDIEKNIKMLENKLADNDALRSALAQIVTGYDSNQKVAL